VYALVAAVELDVTDVELFLLAGDSEPRGSRRRLMSMSAYVVALE
jgi:hypothetical protein